ncbi:alpha/beta-hydrolase [Sporormia fimetaria CBS 119925]|uniref:Carboxylic ester hydrolase n=1 Tax=Sporormia fimetaria CBS 119925 TaxID=1340428 RepID=A0A6A6VHN8_9PLEO|nr:alpha/beta-hydrolase [Sporormia fimetaria CBS 119925]
MLSLLLLSLAHTLLALDTVVDLGYAQYRGAPIGDGSTIQWAGMRYARSVSRTEGMRFAAAQDPVPEPSGTIVDATQFGPICIGTHDELQQEFGGRASEDCLFVNVFAPAKATNESALPVYVFIQGGGFNDNGNANYDGADLVRAAEEEMVVVNFNYRVGPYGFLASKEIVEDETLSVNNGLLDQRQLLKWVKEHISQFGGNPDHVVLGGASAGGGSIVLQLTAYGGRDDSLFHGAFAESPAFPPLRNVEESQPAYDALLTATGCADLKCLREMDAVAFQTAVRNFNMPFPNSVNPPIYFWNPTIDNDLIRDYTYKELQAGNFVRVPLVLGDTSNEGWVFTPKSVTSEEGAERFIADQFTSLGKSFTQRYSIKQAWKGSADMKLVNDARWKKVASDIYAYMRYTCGALNVTSAYTSGAPVEDTWPVWQYRWSVGDALHVSELMSIWHNGTSPASVFMQGYLTSFVRSLDPNQHKKEFWKDNSRLESPTWANVVGSADGVKQRIVFKNENEVLMQAIDQPEWERCEVVGLLQSNLQTESPSSGARRISMSYAGWIIAFLVVAWCG